jgi:hypothetical protein
VETKRSKTRRTAKKTTLTDGFLGVTGTVPAALPVAERAKVRAAALARAATSSMTRRATGWKDHHSTALAVVRMCALVAGMCSVSRAVGE